MVSYNIASMQFQDLKYEENFEKSVQCLNDMVTNALIHVEDCLQYMAPLKDQAIFRFCAIPQVNLLNFILPNKNNRYLKTNGINRIRYVNDKNVKKIIQADKRKLVACYSYCIVLP
jgi:hypothetical protein